MKLQFLGTGGYHPNERRHTACLLFPEIGLQFDAGSAAFRVQPRLQHEELDLFITHAHLDHIVGLTFYIVPLIMGQLKQAVVHARPQFLNAIRQHLFSQPLFPIDPGFVYRELTDSVTLRDGGVVTHIPLQHPGGSTGFRIDWPGKSLAYITDTTVSNDYLDFVRGVDILIHECYFSDAMAEWSPKTGHSNTTPVAEFAKSADVGQLWLVHIDPQHPEDDPIGLEVARKIFPSTQIAEDLLEIEF